VVKKTEIGGINLSEFRRQREAVTQAALAEVASRVEQIQELLKEIQEISEATGVSVSLYGLKSSINDIGSEIDEDWYSSSYSC
jgi:hypothetical protein